MGIYSIDTIKEEMIMFARKNVTDPSSRGSSATETFSGNGSNTQFTVANTNLKHITTVTISSVAKTEYSDFTVEYFGSNKGRITFTTAPATGTNNISVTYKYGDTWIFPEFPKNPLTLSSYPRIAIDIIAGDSTPAALGTGNVKTEITFLAVAYSNNTREADLILNDLRTDLINNAKNFVNIPFVYPEQIQNMGSEQGKDAKVVARSMIIKAIGKIEF